MYKGNLVSRSLDVSSQTLPLSSRRETSLWKLLIWAFKTECVLAVVGQADDRFMSKSGDSARMIFEALQLGHHIPGPTVTGGLDVHEDALCVYEAIRQRFVGPDAWVLMDAGRRAEPPNWCPDLPDVKVRPVMDTSRRKPKPEVWYRDRYRTQGFYCPIIYTGYSDDEKVAELAKAKARYRRFVELMCDLLVFFHGRDGARLTRWSVSGIGVAATPWMTPSNGALAKSEKT